MERKRMEELEEEEGSDQERELERKEGRGSGRVKKKDEEILRSAYLLGV